MLVCQRSRPYLATLLRTQVSTYLPSYLSMDEVYSPQDPRPEDVAVLLEGDEDVGLESIRTFGVWERGGGGM